MNTNAAAQREDHHSVRKALRPAALAVCMTVLLACLSGAGCGQRGPLYLPAQEPPAQPATTEPAPVDTTPDGVDDADEEKDPEAGRN